MDPTREEVLATLHKKSSSPFLLIFSNCLPRSFSLPPRRRDSHFVRAKMRLLGQLSEALSEASTHLPECRLPPTSEPRLGLLSLMYRVFMLLLPCLERSCDIPLQTRLLHRLVSDFASFSQKKASAIIPHSLGINYFIQHFLLFFFLLVLCGFFF